MLKNIAVRILAFGLLVSLNTSAMDAMSKSGRGVKRNQSKPERQTGLWKKKKTVVRQQSKLWKCDQTNRDGSPCSRKFKFHQEYTDHINGHLYNLGLIPAPYECILCNHGCATKSNIYKHLRKGHPYFFDKNTELAILQKHVKRNDIYYEYQPEQSASSEQEEKENVSDSGETTESCYYTTEDEGDQLTSDSFEEEEEEEEIVDSGVVTGYPLLGYQAPVPTVPKGDLPHEAEDREHSDSGSQALSPRSKVLQEYTITPHARRKYTVRKNGQLWTCEKLKLDSSACGKQFKNYADFLRHSNASDMHLNGVMDFGYICTLCHKYKAAAVNNIYVHIKRLHPEHHDKTANELKEFIGILTRHNSDAPAVEFQEKGSRKCPYQGCTQSYRQKKGLYYHLVHGH